MAADEPPRHRPRRDATAPTGAVPLDLVHEILLRLPAKDLCRLRAVCRPWRALLSDPLFAAAHAARHRPYPLIAVGYEASPLANGDRVLCDIVDLSGRVVKRVHAGSWPAPRERVMSSHLDHLIVASTGAVHLLPQGLAPEHAKHRWTFSECWASMAFGKVPSTGKYKVLRVLHSFHSGDSPIWKLFEVQQACNWRGIKRGPPAYPVELGDWYSVVIKHTVYFLLSDYDSDYRDKQGLVASFDLETEKWGESIRAPLSRRDVRRFYINPLSCYNFKIAVLVALSGCLALCCQTSSSTMDIWFLTDFNKDSWVKQQSININISLLHVPNLAQTLLVLNDGRIAGHKQNWAFILQDYNQNTIPMNKPHTKYGMTVGLYGGNLLSLENCMI
ncbi:hypothetical protein HU200_015926 [Digitaria exilis]|uniref:F-box domain-containing protein n=1 Tax=Digitaria exilis TaxID=1010633 RepID=A0A835F9G0_9POAL|nr:hypothetical protein HU200_015926 [Digitaria exilis]